MSLTRFLNFLIALVLLLSSFSAGASVTGTISGTVTDPTGSFLPHATMTLTEVNNGLVLSALTDNLGHYTFPVVPVGRYRLLVQISGFKTYVLTDIDVNDDSALIYDIRLVLGEIREQIEVSSDLLGVEHSNTSVGGAIASPTIHNLPLNGRSYIDLLALQPGVVPVSSGILTFSGGTFGGSSDDGNLSISGQREVANSFQVNGGSVNEVRNSGAAIIPNLDAIEEFRVVTSNSDAEYSATGGGIISVTTKGGTNAFHGTAFEYLRNDHLDSRNYFALERERYRRNQFGGTVGGPVRHDRLFFFVDYQKTLNSQGVNSGQVPVLSELERSGDFTDNPAALSGAVGGGLSSPYFAGILSNRLGYTVISGEPYYVNGCTSSAQCVFPYGIIPQNAWSPAAVKLLTYVPLSTATGPTSAVFNSVSINSYDDDRIGARLDTVTSWGSFSGYYFFDKATKNNQYGDNSVPGFPTTDNGKTQYLILSNTVSRGSRLVNVVRAGITRYVSHNDQPTQGAPLNLADYGFNVDQPGGLIPADASAEAIPTIDIAGGASFGEPLLVYSRFETVPQVSDSLSIVVGTHLIKAGGDFHYTNFIQFFPLVASNGAFFFFGAETGSGYGDFLLGAPTFFAEESQLNPWERGHVWGLYGQDTWRVSSSLTVNYGLRWDVIQPYYERNNEKATYVLGAQSSIFPTAPVGMIFPGDHLPGRGTVPASIAQTPHTDFAPRLGFAYSPSHSDGSLMRLLLGGAGQSSIRASVGVYYAPIEGAQTFFTDPSVPYLVNYTSPVPSLFESPLTNRTNGTANAIPLPFEAPKPGQRLNFAPYLPITGYPVVSLNNVTPYTEQYQVEVQRAIGGRSVASIGYVGNQGHHLPATVAVNPGNPSLCLALPGCGPFGENASYQAANGATVNSTRQPFGSSLGDDYYMATVANSSYSALRLSVRFTSKMLLCSAGYSYGKALDDASAGYNDIPLDPLNIKPKRALSVFDVTHNLVFQGSMLLPVAPYSHISRAITKGWSLGGIARITGGLPVTITENDDRSLLGLAGSGIGGEAIDEPQLAPGTLNITNPRSGAAYFNTNRFSAEPLGQLGNSSRRFFHGPGIANVDAILSKEFPLRDARLQIRSEWFNVFNHTQFDNPDGNFSDGPGNFGFIRAARDPRIGQFAVRVEF